MNKYAELILKKGIQIQVNEPLLIVSSVEKIEFVRILTQTAYNMGIKKIDYLLEDDILKYKAYQNLSEEEISESPLFDKSKLKKCSDEGGCVIFLEGEDPDLMNDISPNKIATARKVGVKSQGDAKLKRSKYIMPWVIVAVPTKSWAEKVFPKASDPIAKLWEAIFKCCYIYEEDPLKTWEQKKERDAKRSAYLTQLKLKKLHYKNSLGTDFQIELNQGTIWEAASTWSPSKKRDLLVNIPTEEIFTSPNYKTANGIVYSSKPLIYNGNTIENFYLVFKDGKVVEYQAKKGEEILKSILETDDGSSYLGEIALVEYQSPIAQSEILFYTTLFDENASCHLALGDSFPLCIEGGAELDKQALLDRGMNQSETHVDFMIGTKDLSIVGEDANGKKYQIFENGNFVLEDLV